MTTTGATTAPPIANDGIVAGVAGEELSEAVQKREGV